MHHGTTAGGQYQVALAHEFVGGLEAGRLDADDQILRCPHFFERCAHQVTDFLVGQLENIAGSENARRFFPVIATFFIFILLSNWMGLLPFFNAIGKTEDIGHHIFHGVGRDVGPHSTNDLLELRY